MKSLSFKTFFTAAAVMAAAIFMQACQPPAPPECASNGSTYTVCLNNNPVFNVGKTVFDVTVVDTNSEAISGLNLIVDPQMDMTTMVHTTPVESVADNGDGTYTVTAYFLMEGTTWSLNYTINGSPLTETTPITVGGDMMMDKGTLKGISDKIKNAMNMPESRKYFIFKSSLDATAGNVDLFLATQESLLNMPAVFAGKTLTNETSTSWTVGTITLEICTTWSGTSCSLWAPLTDQGNGHFTATGLGTLPTDTNTSMMAPGNQFAVHLKIAGTEGTNADWKTHNGTVPGLNPATGNGTDNPIDDPATVGVDESLTVEGNEFVHINQ